MTAHSMRFGNEQGDLIQISVLSDSPSAEGMFGVLSRINSAMVNHGNFVNLDKSDTFKPTSYPKIIVWSVVFSALSTVGMYWLFTRTLVHGTNDIAAIYEAMPYIGGTMLFMCLVAFMVPQYQQRSMSAERRRVRAKLVGLGKL